MIDAWRPEKFDAHEESLREAVRQAARFVSEVRGAEADRVAAGSPCRNHAGRWLTFLGECGCGKTMLARAVFEEASKSNPGRQNPWITGTDTYDGTNRRPRAVFLTQAQLVEHMKANEDWNLPEYLRGDFLLVVDDVGATRDKTDFEADVLFRIAAARMGLWTIFTSNLYLEALAKAVDSRFASRLIRDANVCVRINAGDYAMRRKS